MKLDQYLNVRQPRDLFIFAKMKIVMAFVLVIQTQMVLAVPIAPKGVSPDRLASELLWKKVKDMKVGDRPKITLVLGGGGARGLSHIGVLKVLEQENIPIDQILGVSVGALIGALYAGGIPIDEIEKMAHEVGWDQLTNYNRVGVLNLVLNDKLLSTERMEMYLEKHLGKMNFSELKIPFSCVATDIQTGERVVFNSGPVAIAARASATIPGIFKPVSYEGRLLVDGGLIDIMPDDIGVVGDYKFVIGVLPVSNLEEIDVKSVFNTLVRSIEIQRSILNEEDKKTADFVIESDLGAISMIDVGRSKEAITVGETKARAYAVQLKKKILAQIIENKKRIKGSR